MSYSKLIIVGRLGKNPEMRYAPSGTAVTNFSVATSRKWTNSDGSPGEETLWIRVAAWGKLAEVCNEYLSKGRQVLVEGTLTPDPDTGGPRVYTRQDGSAGASFEMRAFAVKFLGGRGEQMASSAKAPTEDMEDIPF